MTLMILVLLVNLVDIQAKTLGSEASDLDVAFWQMCSRQGLLTFMEPQPTQTLLDYR